MKKMKNLTRLPVQHKHKPHCPNCEAPLPTFESAVMIGVPETECELLKLIFQIRCTCGSIWNIERNVKQ